MVVVVVKFWVLPLTTRLPPAIKVLWPVAVSATVSALISVTLILAPVALTEAKSLLACVSAMLPPVEVSVVSPVAEIVDGLT